MESQNDVTRMCVERHATFNVHSREIIYLDDICEPEENIACELGVIFRTGKNHNPLDIQWGIGGEGALTHKYRGIGEGGLEATPQHPIRC